MISVVAFHFLAGAVTGSIFAVRTLLTLVAFVLMECVGATIAWGLSTGFGCWEAWLRFRSAILEVFTFEAFSNMRVLASPTFTHAATPSILNCDCAGIVERCGAHAYPARTMPRDSLDRSR